MTLWSQGCSELVKLLHGCDEVVARLSQGCHRLVTRLQGLYNLVISVWDVFLKQQRMAIKSKLNMYYYVLTVGPCYS